MHPARTKTNRDVNNKVICVDQLSAGVLHQLFNDSICVLHVKHFCDTLLSNQLAKWFEQNEALTHYDYVMKRDDGVKSIYYGVDRVGIPYNSTYGDIKEKEKYYEQALKGIRAVRSASSPYLSPIDRLRVELDENWSRGANLANFEGSKMFIGIGRIMKAELSHLSELQPHWDSVPAQYAQMMGQYSANIYLSVPARGGELEIWDVPPIATSVIHANDPHRDWRAELPPSILVKPEKGDLLLFNTRRPHAIRSFASGIRVAVQCFIGLNQDQSLSMWT